MDNLQKGKKLFLIMVIGVLAVEVISVVLNSFNEGTSQVGKVVIRTSFEALILYYIYKGKNWARILMIVLLSISILGIIVAIVISMNIILLALLAIYGGCLYVLVFSSEVKEYLQSINN